MLLFNLSTEFDENGKQNAVADSDLVYFLFIVQFYDIILSITFFLTTQLSFAILFYLNFHKAHVIYHI